MNIKILDSWLREHVKTNATAQIIAEKLSLTSVGIEHITKFKNDFVYDIEVTTNRPEMMSVLGIAQETATVLPQSGIDAKFTKPNFDLPDIKIKNSPELIIKNDPRLVRRICAVILQVQINNSPQIIKDRLESTDIRSLNNVVDITNYVMRETGHPTHVFDYDRLTNHTINIRESKKGEKIKTLDGKEYILSGGDIVADNGKGEIIDLLGIMGTSNSVVTNQTKNILFFIDNVEPSHIRKTSMEHGIRTEAAILNEKDINPEYAKNALITGINLFEKLANGKIISNIIDIYPAHPKATTITLTQSKITNVTGITIPIETSIEILTKLGFQVDQKDQILNVSIPLEKTGDDMQIAEDLIEEIARVYGYHNIPNTLPKANSSQLFKLGNDEFYWEDKIKAALQHWGFIEVYTYPMVSKELYKGNLDEAVTIQNPLTEDFVYMRSTLIPSLQQVARDNKDHESIYLFELANVYEKTRSELPKQSIRLGALIQKPKVSFYEVKGIVEQLLQECGINTLTFKQLNQPRYGASISIDKENIGVIEILDELTIDFELDFTLLLKYFSLKRIYKPVSKFPPVVEDLALNAPSHILTGEIIATITSQSPLITQVTLLDKYKETRTFHIVYQSHERNLTDKEIGEIREKLLIILKNKLQATLKI